MNKVMNFRFLNAAGNLTIGATTSFSKRTLLRAMVDYRVIG